MLDRLQEDDRVARAGDVLDQVALEAQVGAHVSSGGVGVRLGVGVDADDVQLDKAFVDDLDVDSLSMVEVVVACEEKFGVSIPDDEVKNLKTVGDAVAFIERAQG